MVRAADRCDECAHERHILYALGGFNAATDIDRVRAQLTHCVSRILHVQATTQNGPTREFCGNERSIKYLSGAAVRFAPGIKQQPGE